VHTCSAHFLRQQLGNEGLSLFVMFQEPRSSIQQTGLLWESKALHEEVQRDKVAVGEQALGGALTGNLKA
jgi:hypothetical protein